VIVYVARTDPTLDDAWEIDEIFSTREKAEIYRLLQAPHSGGSSMRIEEFELDEAAEIPNGFELGQAYHMKLRLEDYNPPSLPRRFRFKKGHIEKGWAGEYTTYRHPTNVVVVRTQNNKFELGIVSPISFEHAEAYLKQEFEKRSKGA
jgi:hypothetical protein